MPALNLGEISLMDPNGSNVTTFDIDPDTYDPMNAPIRGGSFQTVGGGVVNQSFGVIPADNVINLAGIITKETVQALWTKYIEKGKVWRIEDWLGHKLNVIFKLGEVSFHPTPIRGSCEFWNYTAQFQVCEIVQWFGGSYQ